MLGGAALLADGILTPAVTVTTAIEGLRTIPAVHAVLGDDQGRVVAITLAIIIALFLVQRIGTAKIGHAFGPIMTLWFLFLGGTGLFFVFQHPAVLLCLNPLRGIAFLLSPNNHAGIMILGSASSPPPVPRRSTPTWATSAAATSTLPGHSLSAACCCPIWVRALGL